MIAPVGQTGRQLQMCIRDRYLSERSDPLIVQICADYGLEVPRPEPGKPERRFQFCGGKIYHSDYPDGDQRYPALSPRDEFLDYVGQALSLIHIYPKASSPTV